MIFGVQGVSIHYTCTIKRTIRKTITLHIGALRTTLIIPFTGSTITKAAELEKFSFSPRYLLLHQQGIPAGAFGQLRKQFNYQAV
jgi:hypothetical protein